MPLYGQKSEKKNSKDNEKATPKPENTVAEGGFGDIKIGQDVNPRHVMQLQRLIGNTATINYLNKGNQIQRCGGNPDCQCPKCKAKRAAAEFASEDSGDVINRAPSPKAGTKLTAPDIAGNARLQAAFAGDQSKFVRFGQHNDAVEAIQKALLKLNYQLPRKGADSWYGSETKTAIQAFQDERGEAPDGVVGRRTLAKLDSALLSPAPPTPVTPSLTPLDKDIKGVFDGADQSPNRIFFDKNSASLTDDKTALSQGKTDGKIKTLAKKNKPLTLTGLRSEDETDALAQQRVDAVAAELTKEAGSSPFSITKDPKPLSGDGRINYRTARVVAVSETGAASPIPDCKKIPCPNKPKLLADFALAGTKIDQTIAKLSDPATDGLLTKYFNTTPANKADTVSIITKNLTKLKVQLATHLQTEPATNEKAPGMHCGTECFEICTSSAAFVDTGINSGARMVLCPSYFSTTDVNKRAELLLHEGSHSITWETTGGEKEGGTDDHAYEFTRLNTQLETEFALVNADSYVMFISELLSGGKGFDPGVPQDKFDKSVDAKTKKEAEKAIAYFQMYSITTTTSVDGAYSGIEDAQKAGHWDNSFGKNSFTLIARRFGLTMPPAPPTNDDQTSVAAIFDRVDRLSTFLGGSIEVIQDDKLALTEWIIADRKLKIGQDFKGASSDRQRLEIVMQSLLKVIPIISSNVADQYAGLINDMRSQRTLAEAPTQ